MTIDTQPRVAVVTGASSGIGKAAAQALAIAGWSVIGLGRDSARCEIAERELRAVSAPGARIGFIRCDLSRMDDTVGAAQAVTSQTRRIDALLNNAGGIAKGLTMTAEGLEWTFACNHLGPFLFTNRLLPLLRSTAVASGGVRILTVSSQVHERSPGIDWQDIQACANFDPIGAYANAKLANLLFNRALAKRLASDNIVAHAMHPGMVESNFFSHASIQLQQTMVALKHLTVSPEQAADTLVWLATAREAGTANGGYFHRRASVATSAAAQDAAAAERLWLESEALIARALS
jgi:NAD(P)-dependent dehydrogenase (short-subunit alcohol dehydrogenase family)